MSMIWDEVGAALLQAAKTEPATNKKVLWRNRRRGDRIESGQEERSPAQGLIPASLMALAGDFKRKRFAKVARATSLLLASGCDNVLYVTTQNPFPGMNPFFEQQWRDAHSTLLTYLRDVLQERLPADLVARAEEEVVTIGADRSTTRYRPDFQVREPWTLKEPGAPGLQAPAPPADEPIHVTVDEEVERWIEIRDVKGRLITVLELLSPTNKIESVERDRYIQKRRSFIHSGANLVEIDLVRPGTSVFPKPIREVLQGAEACYAVCVSRATHRGEHELYPIRLRERLPAIRVPLRQSDSDEVVDLQALVNQCHERGRYHFLDYNLALDPPLSAEDAAWAEQLLRQNLLL
jgi:hypothetical protein